MSQFGGCRCGDIRFEVEGQPGFVAHCHCADCRAATSAAFSTYAGFGQRNFRLTRGQPRRYQSSVGVVRSFCGTCGTPLTFESVRWPEEVHILVGSFDRPQDFIPTGHVYVAEQLPWIHLADNLPRYDTTSSAT